MGTKNKCKNGLQGSMKECKKKKRGVKKEWGGEKCMIERKQDITEGAEFGHCRKRETWLYS